MKKHLDLEVTALTALHQGQFEQYHETSLRDLGMRPVSPAEEVSYRRAHPTEWVGEHKTVPHERIRAGQYVVSTHRVKDIAEHGVPADADDVAGTQLPTGDVMLTDGHHRVVADMLNGKKSSKVFIGSRYK